MDQHTCHTCLYARWDPGRWLRSLPGGWPAGPTCINHPDSPGQAREMVSGRTCRNYRPSGGAGLARDRPQEVIASEAKQSRTCSATGSMHADEIRRIPLTRGLFALVTAADYEWLSKHRWSCRGGGNPYAARFENGKVVWMHREIMKTPPDKVCDHVDGNGLNNVPWNLRNCNRADNVHNLSKAAHGTSIYKGVFRDKTTGKWCAKVCHQGRRYWLGTFASEIEAARAYDKKAVELFATFARLNFPQDRG